MQTPPVTHATLIFERIITAPVEKVYAAYTNLEQRLQWGAPSEGTALIYDEADFSEGGKDIFRCGPKANPNIQGTTRYLDIVPNQRIVSSETIAMDGHRLCPLSPLELTADGESTELKITIQLASFVGADMVRGHKNGTNASLNNWVKYFES